MSDERRFTVEEAKAIGRRLVIEAAGHFQMDRLVELERENAALRERIAAVPAEAGESTAISYAAAFEAMLRLNWLVNHQAFVQIAEDESGGDLVFAVRWVRGNGLATDPENAVSAWPKKYEWRSTPQEAIDAAMASRAVPPTTES